jgi:hypothetical protein
MASNYLLSAAGRRHLRADGIRVEKESAARLVPAGAGLRPRWGVLGGRQQTKGTHMFIGGGLIVLIIIIILVVLLLRR